MSVVQAVVELPGGLCDETGVAARDAELRRLTGEDEAWLASLSLTVPTAAVVSGLLARCTLRLGEQLQPGAERVRRLLVGDRDFLMLALRRLSFGSHFDALLACPACTQTMDMSFEADDIPVQRREQVRERYDLELRRRDGSPAQAIFHLPTGADQEALAGGPPVDPGRALLARCVERIDGSPAAGEELDSLDDASLGALDESIEQLAPTVDLAMRIDCPSCGHVFDADFDLVPFLLEEMRLSSGQLLREIHTLAFYYHWSRSEILALSHEQRRQYVGLISDEPRAGER